MFRESVRDRVLYNLVLFAIVLIGASYLIGQLTAGQDVKIIKDLGLATIEMAGALMTIFIGVGLVSKEIDRRSIFSLLAKPLPRWEFVVGRFATTALLIMASQLVLGLLLALLSYGIGTPGAWRLVPAALFCSFEGFIVAAIAICSKARRGDGKRKWWPRTWKTRPCVAWQAMR